jgi:hypothetical protein
MPKAIPFKTIRQAVITMKAKQFMKLYGDSAQIEILDADNILNYNEGCLNLMFRTNGKYDYNILFIDGQCYSVQSFDNMGC